MRTGTHALTFLLITLLAVSPCVRAQSAGGPNREWSAVMAVRAGERIAVESKTGQKIDGILNSATETGVTVSSNNKAITTNKADVRKVYTVSGNSAKNAALIGAVVGAGGGAALGAAGGGCDRSSFGCLDVRSKAIPAGAAVGAVVGALIGLAIGSMRHRKTLIYEVK